MSKNSTTNTEDGIVCTWTTGAHCEPMQSQFASGLTALLLSSMAAFGMNYFVFCMITYSVTSIQRTRIVHRWRLRQRMLGRGAGGPAKGAGRGKKGS